MILLYAMVLLQPLNKDSIETFEVWPAYQFAFSTFVK